MAKPKSETYRGMKLIRKQFPYNPTPMNQLIESIDPSLSLNKRMEMAYDKRFEEYELYRQNIIQMAYQKIIVPNEIVR